MMRLVTLECDMSDPVNGSATIPAGTPVVVPQYAATHLAVQCRDAGAPAPRVSRMGYYTRPFCGQNLSRRSLLAWRGAGIGDQLIVAGCLEQIKRLHRPCRLGLMCDPNVARALYGGAENLPFEVVTEPVQLQEWETWNYHWIVEGYCDGNHEPDQPDVWQGHLQAIGMDFMVTGRARRVCVPESRRWTERAEAFLQVMRGPPEGGTTNLTGTVRHPFILWQLAASTPMRSLPPGLAAECLRQLVAACPESVIVLAGTEHEFEVYAEACDVAGIAGTTRGLKLQEVFALVRLASVVVAPDSCLGHVAARYETPCVSYWCPFAASSRAATYGSHVTIEMKTDCSPCWAHEYGPVNLQRGCPLSETDATASRYCKGLAAIRPETIVAMVKKEIG